MNRFIQTLAFTLFATVAVAQSERARAVAQDQPAPALSAQFDASNGFATVTAGPLSQPGVLVLLGAFDDTLASLGKGLPSILVNSAILAYTFNPGEELSVSAQWPPLQVMLQAVEVSFAPFSVQASPVLRIGGMQSDGDMPPAAPVNN